MLGRIKSKNVKKFYLLVESWLDIVNCIKFNLRDANMRKQ